MPLVLSATAPGDLGDASFEAAGTIDQITDPGDAGVIPATASGAVALVTAGAETRTVAAPTFAGQTLCLFLETYGGDCVVTFPAAVNKAGDVTATFASVEESLYCVAFVNTTAGGLQWRAFFPALDAVPALT